MNNFIVIIVVFVIYAIIAAILTKSWNRQERVTLLKIVTMALIIRLGLSFVLALYVDVSLFAPDAVGYIAQGLKLAQYWSGEIPHNAFAGTKMMHPGYYYFCGFLYYIFGPIKFAPAYFNCLFGAITILLIANMIRTLFAWKITKNAILLMSFFPSLIFWHSYPLKDALVLLLVVLTFYYYIGYLKKPNITSIALLDLPLIPLYFIRFYLVIVILFVIVFSLFLYAGELSLKRIMRSFVAGLVIISAVFAFGIGNKVLNKINNEANVKNISKYQAGLTSGKAKVLEGQQYKSNFDIIKYLPVRLVYFLFAPFPWQLTSIRAFLGFIEMPFWWMLLPFWFRGFIFMIKHTHVREFMPLIIYTVFLTLLYAIIEGNIGTAFRMRAQVLPFYLIMSSVGWGVHILKKSRLSTDFIVAPQLRR
jgi:hypothetical protein